MRSVGASISGERKEAFTRTRLSLTVGRRCRTRPASHLGDDGEVDAGTASPGTNRPNVEAAAAIVDPRKKSRRFKSCISSLQFSAIHKLAARLPHLVVVHVADRDLRPPVSTHR